MPSNFHWFQRPVPFHQHYATCSVSTKTKRGSTFISSHKVQFSLSPVLSKPYRTVTLELCLFCVTFGREEWSKMKKTPFCSRLNHCFVQFYSDLLLASGWKPDLFKMDCIPATVKLVWNAIFNVSFSQAVAIIAQFCCSDVHSFLVHGKKCKWSDWANVGKYC